MSIRSRPKQTEYFECFQLPISLRFREAGLQLNRLKNAVEQLGRDETWFPKDSGGLGSILWWLVTDGKNVFLRNEDGFLDELRGPMGSELLRLLSALKMCSVKLRN